MRARVNMHERAGVLDVLSFRHIITFFINSNSITANLFSLKKINTGELLPLARFKRHHSKIIVPKPLHLLDVFALIPFHSL